MKGLLIGFFLRSLLIFSTEDHQLYISVIEINRNVSEEQVHVSIKVFADDLQNALRNYSREYKISNPADFITANKDLLEKYFSVKVNLTLNHDPVTLSYVSAEIENDAVFLQFSGKSPNKWTYFKLSASYFTEIYPDQSNILNLTYGDLSFYSRLDKNSTTYETEIID